MFDGEAAPQHLEKNLPELPGGQVVEERINDGAEVEEAVGHGVEGDVAPKEGQSPVRLGHSSHHEPTDLIRKPADHQGGHDET